MSRRVSLHICTCARSATHDMIKTHTTRAHEFTSRAHDLHNMKKNAPLFIIPEEDWSQSKSIEKYEVNKLKNEDGDSCFYAFVQLPGHSSKTVQQTMFCLL